MQPAIVVKDLYFAYSGQKAIWEGLNFTLMPAQRVGIWGANGCGKTTLFNLLLGFLKAQRGEIFLNDVLCTTESQFAGQRASMGYVFQNSDDQLFCTMVGDDIAFGPLNQGFSPAQAKVMVQQTLELFAMPQYQHTATFTLSGGEKKMIALASVWAMRPKILLLDEPTLSLDEQHLQAFQTILKQSDKGWLMTSHDRAFLADTCDEVWQVKNAQLMPVG